MLFLLFWGGGGVVRVWLVFLGSLEMFFDLCGQVFKGTRWMPWH